MQQQPDILLVIPHYNNTDGLLRSLESMRDETTPMDVMVVDDGSPNPPQINPADYSFRLIFEKLECNQGVEHAANAGLRYAVQKKYIFTGRLDAGDLWVPGRAAAQRDYLNAHPDVMLISAWAEAVDVKGASHFILKMPVTEKAILDYFHINCPIIQPAMMMRTSVINKIGYYSDQYQAAEDYEYFWRIARVAPVANLPQVWLRKFVVGDTESISYRRRHQQVVSRIKTQLEYFRPMKWQSWWGIFRSVFLFVLSYRWLTDLKAKIWPAKT